MCLLAPIFPSAHADTPEESEPIARPPAQGETIELIYEVEHTYSASQGSLNREEVESFPVQSSQDLLEVVQGLHVSHHGGQGKAAQFFLRGFDAVHGSDLAISLEGIPLNEVSNIHGQGYLDLHFLPPSLITGLRFVKGPLPLPVGDFGVTAAVDYSLGLSSSGLTTKVKLGTDRTIGAEVSYKPDGAESGTFVYAGGEGGKGVGESREYHMARAGAGIERELGQSEVRAFALGYSGTFQSPGVLRENDIESGLEGFYGAYDVSGGGESTRLLMGVKLNRATHRNSLKASAWGGARTLVLQHNFTGFYFYPDTGDGLQQTQDTLQGGVFVEGTARTQGFSSFFQAGGGVSLRADQIHQTEGRIDTGGQVWQPLIDADITQVNGGGWGEVEWYGSSLLHVMAGTRFDTLDLSLWRYLDDEGQTLVADPTRARSSRVVISPRLSIDGNLPVQIAWFLGYRRGFRSPDARGIEDGDILPVTLTDSWEFGLLKGDQDSWQIHTSVYGIWIDNELIFDHTAGRFLTSGATRRLGAEANTSLILARHLKGELEISYTDGRYLASDLPLPFAPRWLGSAGIFTHYTSLHDLGLPGRQKVVGGVRMWALGRRPLPDGFVSHPAYVMDLTAEISGGHGSLGLDIQNLLGTHWRDGEFVYPSQFNAIAPRSELPVLHITAGTPRALFLTGGWSW